MTKNVCIIHFNTPTLTEHLVESINKHTPDAKIYIFDNSDKKPFTKEYDNVTVFDNTNKQYIDFNKWLKKYPNRILSGGKANKWGSAKHAYSVEKCMELINEPFVLLDSDVLIKKDFSNLYIDDVCYAGEVVYQPKSKIKRVLPFICFINAPLCLQKKVHYFDENYMHGLRVGKIGDYYDTGAAIYLLTEKYKAKHKEIKVADYVVHYGSGSWVSASEKMKRKTHVPEKSWLDKYRNLWNVDDSVKYNGPGIWGMFDHIYCLHNLMDNDRLPKLKSELNRVGIDENAYNFSWKYDMPSQVLDSVFDSKKLSMDVILRFPSRKYAKRLALSHYEIIKEAYAVGYESILILEDDVRFHCDVDYIETMLKNIPDTDVVMFDKMISSGPSEHTKYKQYVKTLPQDALYGSMNNSGVFFIFTSCYSLNRKAMKRIIDVQENKLLPADTPLNDKELTGSFALINMAIREPDLNTRQNETYDRIRLDISKYGYEAVVVKPVEETQKPVVNHRTTSVIRKTVKPKNKELRPKIITTKLKKSLGIEKPEIETKKLSVTNEKKPEQKKIVTRRIHTKASGHNKLYDVY